jgi:hypothetical protein
MVFVLFLDPRIQFSLQQILFTFRHEVASHHSNSSRHQILLICFPNSKSILGDGGGTIILVRRKFEERGSKSRIFEEGRLEDE